MSSKDYTKYAKNNPEIVKKAVEITEPEKPVKPAVDPAAIADPEPTIEPIVEPVATVEEEPAVKSEPEVIPQHKIGRVHNCAKLNVRSQPKATAPIVCELFLNAEVEIDENKSTSDFYAVYTASGLTGFCMKSYIFVK